MKKKGLIISTIVMVVVLIASLTTATYAWFSANAAVQVTDLTLQTKASDGLQIALDDGEDYWNGTLSYATATGWSGDEGWGQTLDFSSLGSSGEGAQATGIISAASTYAVFTASDSGTWYLKDDTANARVWSQTEPENYSGSKYTVAYNQVNADGTPIANAVHVYSSDVDDVTKLPTELTEDPTNGHCLVIPIVVNPTTADIATITCTITVKYEKGTMAKDALKPGMAAAGRIQLAYGKKGETLNQVLYQPFNTYTLSTGTKTMAAGTPGSEVDQTNMTHTFEVTIANNASGLSIDDIYATTLTIWIEGSDNECDNLTAGSGFTLSIDYEFTKKAAQQNP